MMLVRQQYVCTVSSGSYHLCLPVVKCSCFIYHPQSQNKHLTLSKIYVHIYCMSCQIKSAGTEKVKAFLDLARLDHASATSEYKWPLSSGLTVILEHELDSIIVLCESWTWSLSPKWKIFAPFNLMYKVSHVDLSTAGNLVSGLVQYLEYSGSIDANGFL